MFVPGEKSEIFYEARGLKFIRGWRSEILCQVRGLKCLDEVGGVKCLYREV
jgi:hypothetical protein